MKYSYIHCMRTAIYVDIFAYSSAYLHVFLYLFEIRLNMHCFTTMCTLVKFDVMCYLFGNSTMYDYVNNLRRTENILEVKVQLLYFTFCCYSA